MQLKILNGKQQDVIFELQGDTASIGRSSECEIQLADKYTSRTHAFFRRENALFWIIQDLSSKQGLYINDEKVNVWPLEGGDIIRIGRTEIEVIGEKRPVIKETTDEDRKAELADPEQWSREPKAVAQMNTGGFLYRPAPGSSGPSEPLPYGAPTNMKNRIETLKTKYEEMINAERSAHESAWEALRKAAVDIAKREKDLARRERELEEKNNNYPGPTKAERRLKQLKAVLAEEETADSEIPEPPNNSDEKSDMSNGDSLVFGDYDFSKDEDK